MGVVFPIPVCIVFSSEVGNCAVVPLLHVYTHSTGEGRERQEHCYNCTRRMGCRGAVVSLATTNGQSDSFWGLLRQSIPECVNRLEGTAPFGLNWPITLFQFQLWCVAFVHLLKNLSNSVKCDMMVFETWR